MLRASVIISFYNRIDQLRLILAALEQQSVQDFEVIISDDGSKQEVVDEIGLIINQSKNCIKHVWHEDIGFRKTQILNKALLNCGSNYIIFIDGDCIPGTKFIEDHLSYSANKRVVVGRRVELSDELSKQINLEYIQSGAFKYLAWKAFKDSFFGNTRKAEVGIRINSKWFNEWLSTSKKGILGCNFSMGKAELLDLHGFDARYQAPGVGEDTELEVRVRNAGYEIFKPKYALVQFHLWHKKQIRTGAVENMKLLQETIDNKYTVTPYGINHLV